jgi:SHS2 domain-containing protein
MRWSLPQPFEDLDHTADVGLRVEGASPEEALARLVLAEGALLAGGGAVAPVREARVAAEGADRTAVALELLRELLYRFATERVLPAWCEVERFDERAAAVRVGLARWDPDAHAEGVDLKAVTWHAAAFARDGDRWRAQVVFDI